MVFNLSSYAKASEFKTRWIYKKCLFVKDTLKAYRNFKNKQKSVWSNVFWYAKVYIYSESVLNSLYTAI